MSNCCNTQIALTSFLWNCSNLVFYLIFCYDYNAICFGVSRGFYVVSELIFRKVSSLIANKCYPPIKTLTSEWFLLEYNSSAWLIRVKITYSQCIRLKAINHQNRILARLPWWVADLTPHQGKSLWRITAFFFLMNCQSSRGRFSRWCVSHWRTAWSRFPGPATPPSTPPRSCSWPR